MITGASFPIKIIATNSNINSYNKITFNFKKYFNVNNFNQKDDQSTDRAQMNSVKLDQLDLGFFQNINFITSAALYHYDSHNNNNDQKILIYDDDVESFIIANKITNTNHNAYYIDIYFDNYPQFIDNGNYIVDTSLILKSLNETQNDTKKNKMKSEYAFKKNKYNDIIINNNNVVYIFEKTINSVLFFINKFIQKNIEKSGNFFIVNIKHDSVLNDGDYHHFTRFYLKLIKIMTIHLSAAIHYVATQQLNCQKTSNDIAINNPTKILMIVIIQLKQNNDEILNNNRDDAYNNKCDDFLYLTNNNLRNNNTLKNVIEMKIININFFIKNINIHDSYNCNNTQQNINKMPKYNINPNYKNNKNIDIKTPTNKPFNYNIIDHNRINNLINVKQFVNMKYNSQFGQTIQSELMKDNNINNKYHRNLMFYPRGPATNLGWGIHPCEGLRGGGEEKNGNQTNNWNSGVNAASNWPNQQRSNTVEQKTTQSSQQCSNQSINGGSVAGVNSSSQVCEFV